MKKLILLLLFIPLVFSCSSENDNEDDTTPDEKQSVPTNCAGEKIRTKVYGTQEWTLENACNTTYRDGTTIPQVIDDSEWANLTTGAWSYIDNNDPSKGKNYNWFAIAGIHDNDPSTPNKKFAPVGWHVPSETEWQTLQDYLIENGHNYDGTNTGNKIAKSMASNVGWNLSNLAGTPGNDQSINNKSEFNAKPDLNRFKDGKDMQGHIAIFWSSTEGIDFNIYFSAAKIVKHSNALQDGFFVRLIKD